MQDLEDIWSSVLEQMRKEFSGPTISIWFENLILETLTDKTAVFVASSEFKRDIIKTKYSDTISDYMKAALGFPVTVEIKCKSQNGNKEKSENSAQNPEPSFYETKKDEKSSYNAAYTFDNFIVGNSNKFAHAASVAVANNPGKEYNPLFIYGPSGLGKTHLMYAITNHLKSQDPDLNIVYVKGEEFTNQMIESIRYDSTENFREKYRQADVLLIDDIQFIAGKNGVQEEIFNTFNALYEENKQIILASDRPPKDINLLEERLRTRFESGLLTDIQPPDFELRLAILKSKAEIMGLKIPNEVLNYIAENLKNNVRQLEGAIKKVSAQSLLSGEPMTVDLTISCISDMMTGSEPMSVTADKILDKVSKKYGISAEDLKSKKRTSDIASARHVSVYIIKKMTDMSYQAIGKIFNRDYATMISSVRLIEGRIKNSPLFEIEINQLMAEVRD